MLSCPFHKRNQVLLGAQCETVDTCKSPLHNVREVRKHISQHHSPSREAWDYITDWWLRKGITDEKKWTKIYLYLFSDTDRNTVPLPYYDTDHGSVNVFPVDLTPQPTVEPMTTIGQCSRAMEGGPVADVGHCSLQDMAELFQGYNRGHIYDGDGEPFVYDGDPPTKKKSVYVWKCCQCSQSGIGIHNEYCPECQTPRCFNCEMIKVYAS